MYGGWPICLFSAYLYYIMLLALISIAISAILARSKNEKNYKSGRPNTLVRYRILLNQNTIDLIRLEWENDIPFALPLESTHAHNRIRDFSLLYPSRPVGDPVCLPKTNCRCLYFYYFYGWLACSANTPYRSISLWPFTPHQQQQQTMKSLTHEHMHRSYIQPIMTKRSQQHFETN